MDRLLPAGIFGFGAASRLMACVQRLNAFPADGDLETQALYRLDLVHQGVAFLFLGLVSLLCLTRQSPRGNRASPVAQTIGLLGTIIMVVPALQTRTIDDQALLTWATILTTSGLVFTVYAVGSLGRCFGIAPEARGLVTGGAYRLVRHPIYLGEFIAGLGVFLPVLSPAMAVAFVLFVGLQFWRMRLEERALESVFSEYAEYRRTTPALFPWLKLSV